MVQGYRRFIFYIKREDIYLHNAEDVGTRFVASNYELDRLLHKTKNEKIIG